MKSPHRLTLNISSLLILACASAFAADQGVPKELKAGSKTLGLWKIEENKTSPLIKDLSAHGRDLVPQSVDVEDKPGFQLAKADPSELKGEKGVTIQALIRPVKPEYPLSMIAECLEYKKSGWRLGLSDKGNLYFLIESDGQEQAVSAPANIFDGATHFIEASYDVATGDAILRIDGDEVKRKTMNSEWNPFTAGKGSFSIGNGLGDRKLAPNGWWAFQGDIEAVKIVEGPTP